MSPRTLTIELDVRVVDRATGPLTGIHLVIALWLIQSGLARKQIPERCP